MSNTNWIGGGTNEQRESVARAMDVANDGAVLLQTFINRTVQQLTVRELGLLATLPRKRGSGDKEYINQRTALTAGQAASWVTDLEAITDAEGTYSQVTFAYKSMVARGKITRKLQARAASYGDILATEMALLAEDFSNALEDGLVNGNDAANTSEPMGFLTLLMNAGSVVANTTGSAGGAAGDDLSLSKLDAAIDAVKGSSNRSDLIIYGNFAGLRALNAALQGDQQFTDMTEIAAGFRVRSYDGIPIVHSTAIKSNIDNTGTADVIKNFSGSASYLMVLNTRYCYIAELTPTTVMPLSRTSSQFDQFDMFWDGAPVLANSKGGSILLGVKVA